MSDHKDDSEKDKEVTIIVNGRRKVVTKGKLTFQEVLALAFDPVPQGENWLFTVSYTKGPKEKPKGTLTEGQSVNITNGMIFNVTATDKS